MIEPLKVLELFAGIGACSKALDRLSIPHKIVDAVEIDKYAIKSFNAIHGTSFMPQDITKWNKDTFILYGRHDDMQSKDLIEDFSQKFNCNLKMVDDGEHFFHTNEQLA